MSYASFVHGFPWFRGRIPPSLLFLGYFPTYYDAPFVSQDPSVGFNFESIVQTLNFLAGSYSFSLIDVRNTNPISTIPISVQNSQYQRQYISPEGINPL